MVGRFLQAGTKVYFQSENGIIGFGARPPERMEDLHLTDAGRVFVSALPGAVAFDSAMSFALIRGGHLDMTVLGGLQWIAAAGSRIGSSPEHWSPAWAVPWIWSVARAASSWR